MEITFSKKQYIKLLILAILLMIAFVYMFFRLNDLEKYKDFVEKENRSDIVSVSNQAGLIEASFSRIDFENPTDYEFRIIVAYLSSTSSTLAELQSRAVRINEDYFKTVDHSIVEEFIFNFYVPSYNYIQTEIIDTDLSDFVTIPSELAVELELSEKNIEALELIRKMNKLVIDELSTLDFDVWAYTEEESIAVATSLGELFDKLITEEYGINTTEFYSSDYFNVFEELNLYDE